MHKRNMQPSSPFYNAVWISFNDMELRVLSEGIKLIYCALWLKCDGSFGKVRRSFRAAFIRRVIWQKITERERKREHTVTGTFGVKGERWHDLILQIIYYDTGNTKINLMVKWSGTAILEQLLDSLGGLFAARFLKWLPLMTSTESRPVVALYTSPSRISGADPWPADGNDEAVSLHDTSDTLAWESLPWDTIHFWFNI